MNFDGTFAAHAKHMHHKFDGLARKLQQSGISSVLSRVYYNTFYIPAVQYSLPVTSLTLKELHRVQSLMTAVILNRLGYNRNFPHDVAFAATHVFGVGLMDLRIEHGLSQLQSLLDYVGTDQKVGNVIQISLRHLQIEAGVSFDLLTSPSIPLSYLTTYWVQSVRQFCAIHEVSVRSCRTGCHSLSELAADHLWMWHSPCSSPNKNSSI
jgi:hypothetical protein